MYLTWTAGGLFTCFVIAGNFDDLRFLENGGVKLRSRLGLIVEPQKWRDFLLFHDELGCFGSGFRKEFRQLIERALPALREEKLSEYTEANLPYTAAIASFKLFGDCTASRQYLSIAAKLNPIILVKILARLNPPSMIDSM